MSELIKRAEAFARKAHEGQFRWDKKTPYITHPEAVANRLDPQLPELVAVAWLHDVVEDTDTTLESLSRAGFPPEVLYLLALLTHRKDVSYTDYILRIKQADMGAIAVKLADLNDNLKDLKKGSMRDKYELARYILEH